MMTLSFQYFQVVLALAMVTGLVLLVLPVFRFVKSTRVPLITTVLVLLPIGNIAWLAFLAANVKSSGEY
jgi:uncharacterized membrane protein (UPF0136 family)